MFFIKELDDLEIRERVGTTQTTALLISARRVMEKSYGDLGRRAVTQTTVKNHQLTLA